MSKFDDVLEGLSDRLSEDELRQLRDASALRREAEQAEQQAKATADENRKLRDAVLKDRWKEAGAVGDPTNLRLPDGLDITDSNALKDFARAGGFLPANPDVPSAELDAHQRVAAASTGAAPAGSDANDTRRKILEASDPNEFWARAAAAGQTVEPYHHTHDFHRLP